MKSNPNHNLLVLLALVSLISISSGCQSGFTKPDLGRLAFWKKDDIRLAARRADELAPPSSHFNPEPTDGGSGTKVAGGSGTKAAAGSREAVRDELQSRVDNILAKANKKKAADMMKNPMDEAIGKTAEKIGKINKQLFGPDGKRGEVSQQAINDIQSKLNALKKSASMNKAEAPAMAKAATAQETANDFVSDFQVPANNLKAKAEQMVNTGVAKAESLQTKPIAGWSNDFSAMDPNAPKAEIANTEKTANNFLAASKNKLADAAQTIKQATSTDDNSFEIGAGAKNAVSKIGNNAATAAGNMFAATKNMAAKATQSAGNLASSAQKNMQNMAQNANDIQQRHNLLQPMQNTANSIAQKAAAGQKALSNIAQYDGPNLQLKPQPTNTTATIKYNGSTNKTSQYPATPYGQFKSGGASNDYSMNTMPGVTQAGGNANLNTKVQQATAENEIPMELLQGNNSFAPGSTKQ